MKHLKKMNEWIMGGVPNLTQPDLTDGAEKYLQKIGVNVTPAQEGLGSFSDTTSSHEPNVNIRIGPNMVIYGFKFEEDLQNLKQYADTNGIEYEIAPKSEGARHPFHLIVKK